MPLVRAVDVDVVFGLSLAVDALWLWAAGVMAGLRVRPWRVLLAAALGAAADVLSLFPAGAWLRSWPVRLAGTAVLLGLAYAGAAPLRSAGRLLLYFYAAGVGIAGITLLLGSGVQRGVLLRAGAAGLVAVPAVPASSPLVLAGAALLLVGGRLVLGSAVAWRRARAGVVPVRVEIGGESVQMQALVDTGNRLRDPLSGAPVVVADRRALGPLLPPELLEGPPADPVELAAALPPPWAGRAALIPFRSVGVPDGVLLALRPDRILVQGRPLDALVALAPHPVDPAGRYHALVPDAPVHPEGGGHAGQGLT